MSGLPKNSSSQAWKSSAMRSFGVTMRVSLGFTSLAILLMIGAWWLGMLPNSNDGVLKERKFLTESLAIAYSGMVQIDRPEQIRPMLVETIRRTPEVLSAGIRSKDGHLIIEIGNHETQWTNRDGQQSTDSQMKVPIALGDTASGSLELRFTPLYPAGAFGMLQDNIFRLFVSIALGSLAVYGGYIWCIMRSVLTATSSGAIPTRIRASLDTLAEGVLILDKNQRIVLANEAFAHLLGVSTKEVEGENISRLPWISTNIQDTVVRYPWEQSTATGEALTGITLGLQNYGSRPALVSINSTPITGVDGSNRGTMVTFDNLTEIEEKNEHLRQLTERLQQSQTEILEQNTKLEFLATHDPLTECLNRRAFFAQMETHWATTHRYGHQLCCIMVDIDHFKAVNDTYGHAVGDQVIQHVAKLLEAGKRGSDIVARYGGEEFVLLLPHVEIAAAVEAAERLRRSIEETDCGSIHFTISLGVTSTRLMVGVQPDGQKAAALLQQADQALYAAKHRGRNQVCRWDNLSAGELDEAHRSVSGKSNAGHANGDTGNVVRTPKDLH